MKDLAGVYYFNGDYRIPITLSYTENGNIKADLGEDYGTFNKETSKVYFENIGKGELKGSDLNFQGYSWKKDNRKYLLFIGANRMHEINDYVNDYHSGLFIEPIPFVFDMLLENLDKTKKFNTNYKGINALVTSESGKEYDFNVFSNTGASSSIYKPNPKEWKWPKAKVTETIKLKSKTIKEIIEEEKWENLKYDVVLDVQGAELEVMKGFGTHLNNINKITVEVSKKAYYNGGVLFTDLNDFFVNNGFKLLSNKIADHDNIIYILNK